VAPSNIYPTRDGDYVLIAGNADNVFRRLAEAVGHPEWAEDERFATHHARGENMQELDDMIAAWTKERRGEEVLTTMAETGVPAGKVFSAADMVEDPHYRARGNIVEIEDPEIGRVPMQNVVPRLSETPGEVRWTGPSLGQHNDEVYGGLLGMSDEERASLRDRGVI
jgi:crotonobetainyl-CoA:carnitine CoA-transferase CaiB-like acyl-CoA transferase